MARVGVTVSLPVTNVNTYALFGLIAEQLVVNVPAGPPAVYPEAEQVMPKARVGPAAWRVEDRSDALGAVGVQFTVGLGR